MEYFKVNYFLKYIYIYFGKEMCVLTVRYRFVVSVECWAKSRNVGQFPSKHKSSRCCCRGVYKWFSSYLDLMGAFICYVWHTIVVYFFPLNLSSLSSWKTALGRVMRLTKQGKFVQGFHKNKCETSFHSFVYIDVSCKNQQLK